MNLFRSVFLISTLLLSSTLAQSPEVIRFNTTGIDIELLSYGGSFGGFYNFHPSPALSLDIESDWSVVQSNDTFSFYDFYNQPITVNNQNLSFVKLLVGATWFPFLETMHPSLQIGTFAAAGPLLALNTADDEKFIERWQEVETSVTPLFRSGLHLKILTGQGSSYNFRLGYDYASFGETVDSNKTYKGIFFQVGLEFLHR